MQHFVQQERYPIINQNFDHETFMRSALILAQTASEKGEVPVGAIIVSKEGKILAESYNQKEQTNDPTAHAEIIAIRTASKILNSWRLVDATVYVTLEPCVMCLGAMINARISKLVYGATDKRFGSFSLGYNLASDKRLNHNFEVKTGILESECSSIISNFFKALR